MFTFAYGQGRGGRLSPPMVSLTVKCSLFFTTSLIYLGKLYPVRLSAQCCPRLEGKRNIGTPRFRYYLKQLDLIIVSNIILDSKNLYLCPMLLKTRIIFIFFAQPALYGIGLVTTHNQSNCLSNWVMFIVHHICHTWTSSDQTEHLFVTIFGFLIVRSNIFVVKLYCSPGWQKLCGGTGGPRRKLWIWTKILSPNIRYFVAN